MAKMPSTESHRCTSVASGWSRSSFPVFFLYSLKAWLKAASRIDLKSEDGGVDVWPGMDEDMVLATVSLLVMMAEWQEYVKSSGKHEASYALAGKFRTASYQAVSNCRIKTGELLELACDMADNRATQTVLFSDNRDYRATMTEM